MLDPEAHAEFWDSPTERTEHSRISVEPEPLSYLQSALVMLSMWAWFGTVWAMPGLSLVLFYFTLMLRSGLAAALLAGMVVLCCLPPGQEWGWYRRLGIWKLWRRYFRVRVVAPPRPYLESSKSYLLVLLPHSVFPMGGWLGASLQGNPHTGLPLVWKAGVATIMFKLPVIKHNYAWASCIPANFHDLLEALRQPDTSASVIPDGIAGIFQPSTPSKEYVYLEERRGFVKLAILAGAPLVPVYYLGQSDVLSFWGLERLSRRLKMVIGTFWGRWYLPIPRPHQIIACIGKPIPVTQDNNPSQEAIDSLHTRFKAALLQLFEENKHRLPDYRHKHLVIV